MELTMMRNKLDSNISVKGLAYCFVYFWGLGEEVVGRICYMCYNITVSAGLEFNHTFQ